MTTPVKSENLLDIEMDDSSQITMGNSGSSDSSTVVSLPNLRHLAVEAPPFMETAVTGWFAILEAQFHLAGIVVGETKFYHVLAALPAATVVRIPSDILDSKNYDSLKLFVNNLFEQTKPELFNQLISSTSMHGKPSLYLEEIKRTASKVGVTDELVKHKFLQAVPSSISAVLASQKNLDLQALGKLADELVVFSKQQVNVVEHSVKSHSTNNPRQASSSQSRPPSTSSSGVQPFHQNQRSKVCRAHVYFGSQAKWCKSWCQWPNKPEHLQIRPTSRPGSPSSRPSSPSSQKQENS